MSETKLASSNPDSMSSPFLKAVLLTPVRFAVHFVAVLVFFLVAITLTQQCELVFEKVELRVPNVTLNVLFFSNWLVKFWYLLFVALIFVDAPLMFCLQISPGRVRWLANVWFVGILLLILVAIGFISLWLAVPLKSLGELELRASYPTATPP